jgi:CBS-domain-containing membrane protein
MTRDVITVPQEISIRAAANLLCRSRGLKIPGVFNDSELWAVPVVDLKGVCVGALQATDFVHWANKGDPRREAASPPTCPYQVQGRLLSGQQAVICTIAEGYCPLQQSQPTTGGRHTMVCLQPTGTETDWQQMAQRAPAGEVGRFMTTDFVAVEPQTPLAELARMMIDSHLPFLIVVDEARKPIGYLTSTNLLAALLYPDGDQWGN